MAATWAGVIQATQNGEVLESYAAVGDGRDRWCGIGLHASDEVRLIPVVIFCRCQPFRVALLEKLDS